MLFIYRRNGGIGIMLRRILVFIGLSAILFILIYPGQDYEEMTLLQFSRTSYHGPDDLFYIDFTKDKEQVKYGTSEQGGFSNFLTDEEADLIEGQTIEYLTLDDEEIDYFIRGFKEMKVEKWRRSYDDLSVEDGEQWGLTLEFADGETTRKSGSNAYPQNWEVFNEFIDSYKEDN